MEEHCLLILLTLFLGMGAGICGYMYYTTPEEPELTSAFVSSRLEAVRELTTARLTYTGLIRYSEGKIPFLTRKQLFHDLYGRRPGRGSIFRKQSSMFRKTR